MNFLAGPLHPMVNLYHFIAILPRLPIIRDKTKTYQLAAFIFPFSFLAKVKAYSFCKNFLLSCNTDYMLKFAVSCRNACMYAGVSCECQYNK